MLRFTATTGACLGSATALGLVFMASSAHADLTASDVWADWQGYLSSSGYDVTGTEAVSGGTLTVSDVTMSIVIPEEDASASVNLGEIAFTENGDGTVSVAFPETVPMTIEVVADGEPPVQMGMDYNSQDFDMTVSGEPNDLRYDYTAAQLAVVMRDMVVAGQSISLGEVNMSVADVVGATTMKVGNIRTMDQTINTGAVNYVIDIQDPEGGEGNIFLKGQFEAFDIKALGALPLEMDAADMAAALSSGFDVDATMTYTSGATEFRFDDEGNTVEGNSSSDGGAYTVALGGDGLTYNVLSTGMKLAMAGGDIPLPIELAFGEAGFNLTMPVAKGEDEQDFAFGVNLGDFTMSDLLWGIFDPTAQLPRDPATIAVDLTGKAKLFFDLMDPEQMESAGLVGAPGELNALDLNSLTVSLAGAELTGQGAFVFDNTDLTTFDGMPAPDGAVDLSLTGGNGLLDKLISMGLVPEDQAMGVRMMMGLFAVPGEGEDSLTSKIEVKSDGQVLANGQRLR